jgi:hypothetical protein
MLVFLLFHPIFIHVAQQAAVPPSLPFPLPELTPTLLTSFLYQAAAAAAAVLCPEKHAFHAPHACRCQAWCYRRRFGRREQAAACGRHASASAAARAPRAGGGVVCQRLLHFFHQRAAGSYAAASWLFYSHACILS